jgi:very-short-patch-repair endonuclease
VGLGGFKQCKMTHIPYNKYLREYSRKLRNNSTFSEVLLWKRLSRKQMKGYTFNRQKPLLNYIVDFYCKPLALVIEIDGSSHDNTFDADLERQKELEKMGLSFLRFEDRDVKNDIDNVLRTIELWIDQYEKDQNM